MVRKHTTKNENKKDKNGKPYVHTVKHQPGLHRSHDRHPDGSKTGDHQTDHDNGRKLTIETGVVKDRKGKKEKKGGFGSWFGG